jgi:hypothetical protein
MTDSGIVAAQGIGDDQAKADAGLHSRSCSIKVAEMEMGPAVGKLEEDEGLAS